MRASSCCVLRTIRWRDIDSMVRVGSPRESSGDSIHPLLRPWEEFPSTNSGFSGSSGSIEGRLGSSIDVHGRFYKPLQDGERGSREIEFYDHMQGDDSIPPHIHAYFPKYYGTVMIDAPNGGAKINIRYGVMEDLAHGFRNPSIIDLKIGFRTWYPEASAHNIEKNKAKDKQTTSGSLGFRVSGMQVYEPSTGEVFKADRDWARNLAPKDVPVVLKRYVSSNPKDETNPNGIFASSVYGGAHGVIAQLEVLKDWFSTQTGYHFASSSVLFIYESDESVQETPSAAPKGLSVKLVDFAHTLSGRSSVDDNFLEGLKAVINILSSIR